MELEGHLAPIVGKFVSDYERLKMVLSGNGVDDTDRYHVYWATKFACKDNKKKDSEGFSDVDRSLLENAVLFARHFSEGGKVGSVAVFSSDEHILNGVSVLNQSFKYKNLISLSSKER